MQIKDIINKVLSVEFFRFAIVGAVATGIHYGLYYLLNKVISVNPSYAIGYIVSFFCNFYLSSKFTFKRDATVVRGLGFALSHVANFTLHMLLLNLFIAIGLHKNLAPVPVYAICIPVNYLLVRLVFNKL